MKLEYDKSADAAYLYLKYPVKDGEAKSTIQLKPHITLDFDGKGKLLGVEILDASKVLNKGVLTEAKIVS
jgi:uncharacterized protein YuzE